jgi:hypothetical protein
MTEDAVKAEEVLAELEANSELAGSVAMQAGATGLTAEEQALYDELEAESKVDDEKTSEPQAVRHGSQQAADASRPVSTPPARERTSATPPPLRNESRRSEPEAS